MATTKAVIQTEWGGPEVMSHGEAPLAPLGDLDVLVRNYATGVNPIDYKFRQGMDPDKNIDPAEPVVVGWDGAGVVEAVGASVKDFSPGDEVYYAGSILKPGSYAEQTVVDSRIVALKPKSLTFAEASTIPLVAETVHEALLEMLAVEAGKTILIYNGAGGVGSFAIQYAKHLGLTVIATASRPETIAWVKSLGADVVINHREDILPQLEAKSLKPDYVFELRDNSRIGELMKSLAPQGRACLTWMLTAENFAKIDSMDMLFGRKTISYEFMFERAATGTEPEKQGELLATVAGLLDEGKLSHTLKQTLPWSEVQEAHRLVEKGTVVGKIALAISDEASLKTAHN